MPHCPSGSPRNEKAPQVVDWWGPWDPSLGLKRGEFAQVVARPDHRVLLEGESGERVAWQPATTTRMGVFVPEMQPLAVGDLVRVTANDRARGLVNGDLGKVVALGADGGPAAGVCLQLAEGQKVWLDGRRPLLLDHGYCSTVYASQGQTCERVLIDADANSLTASRSSFYVSISRARQIARIYTDDREMLPLSMSRELEKASALELVAECQEMILGDS